MGGPSAQSFLVGVLGRCELLLVLVCAPKPAFSEADPSRSARGTWMGLGHIPALGGVSAKLLRGDHRPNRSSCSANQDPTRRSAEVVSHQWNARRSLEVCNNVAAMQQPMEPAIEMAKTDIHMGVLPMSV